MRAAKRSLPCLASALAAALVPQLGCSSPSSSPPDPAAATEGTSLVAPAPTGCAPRAVEVSLDYKDSCAVMGDGHVACWGRNTSGQLGNGSTSTCPNPGPSFVPSIDDAVAVSTGPDHTCVLRAGGASWCWGDSFFGQLGDGERTSSTSPRLVAGLRGLAQQVASVGFTCATRTDGGVSCWGTDAAGTLGDGAANPLSPSPVSVTGITNALAVSAGESHACALLASGTVKCWGFNGSGQIGDGSYREADTPVDVKGVAGVKALASGVVHTCALHQDGSVVCWGFNGSGALGNGTRVDSPTAVAVAGLDDARAIAAGGYETCALRRSGLVVCWGKNDSGQLGDGSTNEADAPAPVRGLHDARAIAVGDGHACAVRERGDVVCWGANDLGQLGDGTTVARSEPVRVVGLEASP
ncbi:MAG TPA: hypothetical protein VGI39_41805 [Polyangiaceae bacterium]